MIAAIKQMIASMTDWCWRRVLDAAPIPQLLLVKVINVTQLAVNPTKEQTVCVMSTTFIHSGVSFLCLLPSDKLVAMVASSYNDLVRLLLEVTEADRVCILCKSSIGQCGQFGIIFRNLCY